LDNGYEVFDTMEGSAKHAVELAKKPLEVK